MAVEGLRQKKTVGKPVKNGQRKDRRRADRRSACRERFQNSERMEKEEGEYVVLISIYRVPLIVLLCGRCRGLWSAEIDKSPR